MTSGAEKREKGRSSGSFELEEEMADVTLTSEEQSSEERIEERCWFLAGQMLKRFTREAMETGMSTVEASLVTWVVLGRFAGQYSTDMTARACWEGMSKVGIEVFESSFERQRALCEELKRAEAARVESSAVREED